MSAHAPPLSGDLLALLRSKVNAASIDGQAKRPFRFLLCGDPFLISELRRTLLFAHPKDYVANDAAATLETLDLAEPARTTLQDARAIIFVGRPGDAAGARFELLTELKLPIMALTVDPSVDPHGAPSAPGPGIVHHYTVRDLSKDALHGRVMPHMVACCKGIEVAVGRRLPGLRRTVTTKLTLDSANRSLQAAVASAVVDHVPILGVVLGAVASAGDMVAITGIQVMLLLQIGAVYGRDPDLQRIWELLPVVGGGFGWRSLARELSGFIPVAGIGIKGAIAYAGTIVAGEAAGFYFEHGSHMSRADMAHLYTETKDAAMQLGRELIERVRGKKK